jgi:hypothetical protein
MFTEACPTPAVPGTDHTTAAWWEYRPSVIVQEIGP